MPRRALRLALILAAILGLASIIGPWLLLVSWVPTKGKARLIEELERRAPIRVTIATMRYDLWRGLLLSDVEVSARQTQALWVRIPELHARLSLSSLLRQRVVIRGHAVVERPCAALVTVTAAYGLRDHAVSADVHTDEIALASITAPLKPLLPTPLSGGTVRVKLHVQQPAQARPSFALDVAGDGLGWTEPAWQLHGNLTVHSVIVPTPHPDVPWSVEGTAALRQARLEGVPVVGPVEQLQGSARFTQDAVEIDTLTGRTLGSPVKLEGTVTLRPIRSLELLLTAEAGLKPLVAALPNLKDTWQPDGIASIRSVCRASLQPAVRFDCLTQARLQQVTLSGSKLAHPLTRLTGLVRYDAVTRELGFEQVEGRLLEQPCAVTGRLWLMQPIQLALHLTGTVPLDMAVPWLPPDHSVTEVAGAAAVDITLHGSADAPQFDGQATVRDGTVALSKPALIVEHVKGLAVLSPDRLQIADASLEFNSQPLTLAALITPLQPPRMSATIGFSTGDLTLIGRLLPEAVVIDDAAVTMPKSRLHLKGQFSRRPERASALDVTGRVELSELSRVPFLHLTVADEWKLQGSAEVAGQFRGRLNDLTGAALQGRIASERLSVRTVPLEQLLCTVEQGDRLLRVRVPTALVAGGKLWGELALKHTGPQAQTYALQADLVGLQLKHLVDVIPAWRSRSVTGTASGHAALSGTWQDRKTWTGDGWVNASGQQLGDIPLLDKLFLGLFGMLGDRLGLESLSRAQITQASCQWRLNHERLVTDDFRLGGLAGTEPVAIYAKGSVGLDRTLDFVIEPELSEQVVLQAPTTSTLARAVLQAAGQLERLRRLIGRHRLKGTLDKPEYRFQFSTQEIFKQLAPAPANFLEQLLDVVR